MLSVIRKIVKKLLNGGRNDGDDSSPMFPHFYAFD